MQLSPATSLSSSDFLCPFQPQDCVRTFLLPGMSIYPLTTPPALPYSWRGLPGLPDLNEVPSVSPSLKAPVLFLYSNDYNLYLYVY